MAKYHDGAVPAPASVVNVLLTVLLAALSVVALSGAADSDKLAQRTSWRFHRDGVPNCRLRRRSPGCDTIAYASPSSTSCNPSAIRRRRSPRSC